MSKITDLFQANADKFSKQITGVAKSVELGMLELIKDLKTKAGRFVFGNDNLKDVMKYESLLEEIINAGGYTAWLNSVNSDFPKLINKMPKGMLKKADAATLKFLQQIDQTELKGISVKVAKNLQGALKELVINGGTYKDAVLAVKKNAGKLEKYAETYVNTSRTQVSQKITDLQAQHMVEDGESVYWEYAGSPIDDKTRDQCVEGLNKRYFTDAEKIEFQGRGLRWNCRHEFVLISKETYDKGTGRGK